MEIVTFLRPDQERHAYSLACAKTDAYNKVKDGKLTEDLISYQINLKNKICSLTSFSKCLNFLIECMSQTSPWLRPNLKTLIAAREHLHSFQLEFASPEERDLFYENIVKKYGIQQRDDNLQTGLSRSIFSDNSFSPDEDDLSLFSRSPTDTSFVP